MGDGEKKGHSSEDEEKGGGSFNEMFCHVIYFSLSSTTHRHKYLLISYLLALIVRWYTISIYPTLNRAPFVQWAERKLLSRIR